MITYVMLYWCIYYLLDIWQTLGLQGRGDEPHQ